MDASYEELMAPQSNNTIFRKNKTVEAYFETHLDERRKIMVICLAHQALFVVGMMFTCLWALSNQALLVAVFDDKVLTTGIVVFSLFCLFNIFCTRWLRR